MNLFSFEMSLGKGMQFDMKSFDYHVLATLATPSCDYKLFVKSDCESGWLEEWLIDCCGRSSASSGYRDKSGQQQRWVATQSSVRLVPRYYRWVLPSDREALTGKRFGTDALDSYDCDCLGKNFDIPYSKISRKDIPRKNLGESWRTKSCLCRSCWITSRYTWNLSRALVPNVSREIKMKRLRPVMNRTRRGGYHEDLRLCQSAGGPVRLSAARRCRG